jgi:hypothetical protein
METPKFLLEMSEQLNTQDNRMTADPLFCVYYDEKVPTSEDYAEGYEYIGEDGVIGDFEELKAFLDDYHHDFVLNAVVDLESDDFEDFTEDDLDCDELPNGVFKGYYLKKKHFVKASLTEVGAQQFIDRKQHDYAPLYIYAESMCYQWQMIELRKWIKSLTSDSIKAG